MSEIDAATSSSDLNTNKASELVKLIAYLVALYVEIRFFPNNKYEYNHSYLDPLAMTNVPESKILDKVFGLPFPNLPKDELPSIQWIGKVIFRLVVTVINTYLSNKSDSLDKSGSLEAAANEFNELESKEDLKNAVAKLVSILKDIDEDLKIDEQLQNSNQLISNERPQGRILASIQNKLQEIHIKRTQFFNQSPQESDNNLEPSEKSTIESFQEIIKYTAKLAELADNQIPSLRFSPDSANLDNYDNLFRIIPKPTISYHFQEDKYFAYMQVAGPNPLMLQQIAQLDSRLPITENTYSDVAQLYGVSDTLNNALAEGRIYLADYTLLDTLANGNYPAQQKYISAPVALFAVPPDSYRERSLFPVAISYRQTTISNEWELFTPLVADTNADTWMTAKNIVQMADSNYHELVSHLGRTHLVVEPFVVATNQLPENHSLKNLLKPHLEGTVLINYGAHTSLIAPGGGVDELLASSIGSDQTLAAKGAQSYLFNFNDIDFPNTLKNRGVDDSSKLPTYPYRDDGLLIWGAIESWVKDYFSLYYSSDSSVLNDQYLQAWASTLISLDGGRLQNLGDDGQGQIKTLDYLVKAVSTVIFTASAQHAAVNFPQKNLMMYPPAFPLARYLPVPRDPQQPENFINGLPPISQAQGQVNLLYLLGSVYYTNLGNYSTSAFTDDRVKSPLEKFQTNLKDIEQQINQRNSNSSGDRIIPYEFLLPTKIPQSINI